MHSPSHSMTKRQVFAVVLASAHLLLVTSSVLGVRHLLPEEGAAGLIHVYAQWTGASSRFNFFAPSIHPSMRATFEVAQDSGEVLQDDLRFTSDAMNVRAYCMLLRFNYKKAQDDMARAWAAKMFGRYPDARTVAVHIQELGMPTMEQYRSGLRPSWKEIYRADFEHRVPSRAPHARMEDP